MKNPEHTGRIFAGAACIVYTGIWYGAVFCAGYSARMCRRKKNHCLTTLLPRQVPLCHLIKTTIPLNISSIAMAIQTPGNPKLKKRVKIHEKTTDIPHIEKIPNTVGKTTSPAALIDCIITRFEVLPNSRKRPISIILNPSFITS